MMFGVYRPPGNMIDSTFIPCTNTLYGAGRADTYITTNTIEFIDVLKLSYQTSSIAFCGVIRF